MKTVAKSSRVQIYPSKKVRDFFDLCFEARKTGWNSLLQMKINNYYKMKANKYIGHCNYNTKLNLGKEFTRLKKTGKIDNRIDSRIKNYVIKDLQLTFKQFYKGISGFPRFKGDNCKLSYSTGQTIKTEGNRLIIPKCEPIRFRGRILNGDLKKVTITKKSGKYYATLFYLNVLTSQLPSTNRLLAIDWGEKTFITTHNGGKFNPPLLKKKYDQLKRLRRRLSQKEKGSNNYNKLLVKIGRLYQKITNITNDWYHKNTTYLVNKYDKVAIEALNYIYLHREKKIGVSPIKKNQYKFGLWKQLVQYKLTWYKESDLIAVSSYHTSKKCSNCGFIYDDLKLSMRTWICPECESRHDRDINAGKNIYQLAFGTVGATEV